MAVSYKDIVITPNKSSSTDDPKIVFSGANTNVNTDITLRVYPESNGTLSFEGTAGQLFSITNDLSGSIFSVNDISGIPSIDVQANGYVSIAPFGGNVSIDSNVLFVDTVGNQVGIGTASPTSTLHVVGAANVSSATLLVAGQNVLSTIYTGDAASNTWANTVGTSANAYTRTFANTKLANTSGVSFAGDLFFPTGNVGIGTTAPATELQILKTKTGNVISSVRNDDPNTGSGAKFQSVYNGTEISSYGHIWDGTRMVSGLNYYAQLKITNQNVEKIRVDANGNVGIGTTTTGTYKLDVNGSINASSVLINGSPITSDLTPANNWSNTKLSNATVTLAGALTTTGSITANATITLTPTDGANEGGQVTLQGAGSYATWSIDSYQNLLRHFNSSIGTQSVVFYNTLGGSNTVNVGINTTAPAASLDIVGNYSAAKANVLSQTLTDAATIAWDTSLGQVATVTLGGNRIMGAPTNLRVGTYILHVIQDATGSRTLDWSTTAGTAIKWPGGVDPVLTTTANARDIFSFISDGTYMYGSFLPDVK